MDQLRQMLVDGRAQVAQALRALDCATPYTLRHTHPRRAQDGEVVTWREYDNRNTECPVVDALSYEVMVWARDLDALADLCSGVNRAMTALGLRREYAAPDEFQADGLGYYTKVFRFGRRIDKRTMRLID